ncbi:DUF2334 domain-containing protein [Kyrpidia spormannii]|uniref:DUF2334 domain-containing protein n=1 Tax=Kyrpidia spormannii TaxID=2055160 RepID=UPI0012FFF4D5|nr:DUF2334 domain-containing protein [Kyrpidia spormannii]
MRPRQIHGVRIAVILLLFLFIPVQTGLSVYQNLWPDHRHVALLRFEDVSAGPPYQTPEDLGKLRAVMEFLAAEKVPYQITVVPRYLGTDPENRPVVHDITQPDAAPFVTLLRWASKHGAVVGVHGYTHQYGQPDWRNPGTITTIGREFEVPHEPLTDTPEYAARRLTAGVHSFAAAGLVPGFWETPHYAATAEQERALRSNFGILYEPDRRQVRSLKDIVPRDGPTASGAWGAVYIPTPLGYVRSDQPEDSVKRILYRASFFEGLGSLYYHPVLEFPFLEPVKRNGRQVWRDGLPEYRYRPGPPSYLHQLIDGLGREGYTFESLHQVVPLQPAWQYTLPGDLWASGRPSGQAWDDWVSIQRQSGDIWVTSSERDWLRTSPEASPQLWGRLPPGIEAKKLWTLDINGDGRDDLLVAASNAVYAARAKTAAFGSFRRLPISLYPKDTVVAGYLIAGRPSLVVFHSEGTAEGYVLGPDLAAVSPPVPLLGIHSQGPRTEWFAWNGEGSAGDHASDLGLYRPDSGEITLYKIDHQGHVRNAVSAALPPALQIIPAMGDPNLPETPVLIGYMAGDGRWMAWRVQGQTLAPAGSLFGPWMAGRPGQAAAGRFGVGLPCVAVASAQGGRIDIQTAISYFGWVSFSPD